MNLKNDVKTRFLFLKVLSCVCLLISFILLFQSWITVSSSEYKREIRKGVRSAQNEFNDYDSDDLEDVQDELDEYDVDLSIRKVVKYANQVFDSLKDAGLSPKEVASLSPGLIKTLNAFEDAGEDASDFFGSTFEDAVEEIGTAKISLILGVILFYITIIVELLCIVFHILNKKFYGYTAVVLNIIWMIIFGRACGAANDFALEMVGEKVVRLSASPYFAIILTVGSIAAWIFAMKDYPLSLVQPSSYGGAVNPSVQQGICVKCGQVVKASDAFCPSCGAKVTAPEKTEIATMFCPHCGKTINADAVFCPHCGKSTEIN